VFTGHTHNYEKNLLHCAWSPDGAMVSAGSSDRCGRKGLVQGKSGSISLLEKCQYLLDVYRDKAQILIQTELWDRLRKKYWAYYGHCPERGFIRIQSIPLGVVLKKLCRFFFLGDGLNPYFFLKVFIGSYCIVKELYLSAQTGADL
jgi:hypothetical protein